MRHNLSRWAITVLCSLLFLTVSSQSAVTDTSFLFFFEVNMTKAVHDSVFDPGTDQVFVTFQEPIPDLLLIKGSYHQYSALLLQELDSGASYHFRFRINDTIVESINREATATQGVTEIREWWNDAYMNTTTFRINANGIPDSLFTPGNDELQIEGEMNQWQAESLQTDGTSGMYEITFHLDPTRYYHYTFRIKTDSSVVYESTGAHDRLLLPPDTTLLLIQYFSHTDTGKVAMLFSCHMSIQEQLGHFDPASDYLDLAGNFNGWGSWDLLYDDYQTGLYQQTLLFDKSMIGTDTLKFKFRINGSWVLAELQGENPREYILQPVDTTGNPNIVEVWYDNVGPVVPSRPWVTDVTIQGLLEIKQPLSGAYLYHHLSNIPEGASLYQWYRADSLGATPVLIDSAATITYTTDSIADLGKYLVFEVTPVAAYGDSLVGETVRVYSTGPVGHVGIPEYLHQSIRLYPNPASAVIVCDTRYPVNRLEIYSLDGRVAETAQIPELVRTETDISQLAPGMYILRVWGNGLLPAYQRFIKQ